MGRRPPPLPPYPLRRRRKWWIGDRSVLKRAQQAAERGESPVGAVFEGFCVVVAGLLLIIPGFLTDF
ncbi:hypothetical protein GAY33_21320, partial [Azospirillum brasilense]|nr:hypothetical protein [Azospirillum argentinense]